MKNNEIEKLKTLESELGKLEAKENELRSEYNEIYVNKLAAEIDAFVSEGGLVSYENERPKNLIYTAFFRPLLHLVHTDTYQTIEAKLEEAKAQLESFKKSISLDDNPIVVPAKRVLAKYLSNKYIIKKPTIKEQILTEFEEHLADPKRVLAIIRAIENKNPNNNSDSDNNTEKPSRFKELTDYSTKKSHTNYSISKELIAEKKVEEYDDRNNDVPLAVTHGDD